MKEGWDRWRRRNDKQVVWLKKRRKRSWAVLATRVKRDLIFALSTLMAIIVLASIAYWLGYLK